MRPAELSVVLVLGALLVLFWIGWLIMLGGSLWVPAGLTALAILLLMARIVFIAVRQD